MRGKHEATRRSEGGVSRGLSGEYGNSRPARVILLMGAPGSGKGTQGSLLESQFGFACVSTGSILREEAKRDTPAGFRLRRIMASGALVDDATVCHAVGSRIADLGGESGYRGTKPDGTINGLILDGFPRTIGQARCLDQLLEARGMAGPLVLHLNVPGAVLLHRLARRRQCVDCGAIYNLASNAQDSWCQLDGGALVERDDDSEGIVARRLAAYGTATLPVVNYYRNGAAIYREIDGNRAPTEVAKEVRDIVLFAGAPVAA